MSGRAVQPPEFPEPRGYVNGMVASGPTLYVAGQVGCDTDGKFPADFVEQFGRALDNVLAVVRAAGGTATDVVKMTVYVTDIAAYRGRLAQIGEMWRTRLGKHYPAMALLGVASLVPEAAQVEIEAVASLPEEVHAS